MNDHALDEVGVEGFGSDLYIGLVRAIGTDLSDSIEALKIVLTRAGYAGNKFQTIKISSFFDELLTHASRTVAPGAVLVRLSELVDGRYSYYKSRMDAGDWLRWKYGSDILAQRAIAEVRMLRPRTSDPTYRGSVYVFDSLMHPDEVDLLRSVYGRRFFLVAVHSTAEHRSRRLLDEFRSSDPENTAEAELGGLSQDEINDELMKRTQQFERKWMQQVDELMLRDEGVSEPKTAQSPAPPARRVAIRKTFSEADVFVTLKEASDARSSGRLGVIERFVEKVFDEPFHTPTRAELGMAHAYVAARRSGSLARAVGAAICTEDGDLLAVGTNCVPAPGGGHYWPTYDGAESDWRDHRFPWPGDESVVGLDSNDKIKLDLFFDLMNRAMSAMSIDDLLDSEQASLFATFRTIPDQVVHKLFQDETVRAAQFFDVIEYSRSVHAEMSALMTCTRNGIPTKGAVLYCTTFPCHECSRHIIASGISRVIYVEPYSKSRVTTLHHDAVVVERFTGPAPLPVSDDSRSSERREKVKFEPFIGISPSRHAQLYSSTSRKVEGKVADAKKLGRKRHWVLGQNAPLRDSLRPRLRIARASEDLMVDASERYVDTTLRRLLNAVSTEQRGLDHKGQR